MSGRDRAGTTGSNRASRQLGLFDPPCPPPAADPAGTPPRPAVTADRSPRFHRPWLDKPKFEQRLILLLDLDAFFASAEQVARPELKGKPVIVGGLASDRSVVASASYEARALGVKTAMPIAQACHICPQGVFLRGNYALYASLSKKVIEICKTFTPLVEQASIDEAYLDLTGTERLYSHPCTVDPVALCPSVVVLSPEARDQRSEVRSQKSEVRDRRAEVGEASFAPCSSPVSSVAVFPRSCRVSPRRLAVTTDHGPRTTDNRQLLQRTRDHGQRTAVNPPLCWPVTLAENLLRTIRAQTGLGASIGIGANKLIARIAMESAKPGGICYVWPGREAAFLAEKSLASIPGIGRRTAEMLADYNLRTAGDVQQADRDLLVATFGRRFGEMLHDCAFGRGEARLELEHEQKSISRETSFEHDVTNMDHIKSMLYYLTERACRALRQMGQAARTVSVKLRYSDFKTVNKSQTLPAPGNHDDAIYKVAEDLLQRLYTRAVSVRLVGIHLSGLVRDEQVQMDLWDPRYLRNERLYEASDRIRERFGFCALMKGPAIALMRKMEHDDAGLKLRTSCLTK